MPGRFALGLAVVVVALVSSVAPLPPPSVSLAAGQEPPAGVTQEWMADAPAPPALRRLAGADRWSTAVAISRETYPGRAPVAYLARGVEPLVDALAGAALSDGPILLVPGCGPVPAVVRDEVARLEPAAVVALGGPAAICEDQLRAAAGGRPVERVAGRDRYETGARIARRAFPDGAATVYLARGEPPLVDALAGASLHDGPVLPVPPCAPLPGSVVEAIAALEPDRVVALGGRAAICDGVLRQAAAGRPSARLVGASRYQTAVAIAEAAFPEGADRVYTARGVDPIVDALAGGTLRDGPILLLPPCGSAPPEVRTYIHHAEPSEVVALGGTAALCEEVLRSAAGALSTDVLLCRQAWGARPPSGDGHPHQITGLMVHHSAVALTDNRDAPQHLREFQRLHQGSGFVDIAYHVAVDRAGNLYELRNPAMAGETYTSYRPSGWLLVVALGNFDEQTPTRAQLEGIARVLAWAAGTFDVDPARVAGHRDAAATRCPGEALYRELTEGRLTARVRELLTAGGVDLQLLCGDAGARRVRDIEARGT